MNIGKKIRLDRIFSHPGGCGVRWRLIIGYGKLTFGGGLSNLPAALKKIVARRPGAITMSKETAMNRTPAKYRSFCKQGVSAGRPAKPQISSS